MRRAALAALVAAVALTGCGGGPERVAAGDLPPGDPGEAAPETSEPTGAPEEHEDEPALTEVPPVALLDARTIAGVLGGTWTPSDAEPRAAGPCGPLPSAAAARSVRHADRSRVLLETVLSYRHGDAEPAVAELARSLGGCGWTPAEAPPLGEHSAAARHPDGGQALVVSAEGAVVVLVGTGGTASDAAAWEALADVALGSACPAAPHGCH